MSTACQTKISQAVSREGSQLTYQRTNDSGDTKRAADEPCEQTSLPQRFGLCDDDKATSRDTCSSDTCNRTTEDESNGIWSSTTESAANLKYHDGREEGPLRTQKSVSSAVRYLESACGQEEGSVVPAKVRGNCRQQAVTYQAVS